VLRVRVPGPLSIVVAVALLAAACGSGDDADDAPDSPCVAFAKASAPQLQAEPLFENAVGLRRIGGSGSGDTYSLDADGRFGSVDASPAARVLAAGGQDFAVTSDGTLVRAFVAGWVSSPAPELQLRKYTSTNGGLAFDEGATILQIADPGSTGERATATVAFGPDGRLYAAFGDPQITSGGSPLLGKILRIDVSSAGAPEIWATGLREPRGLDVDPATSDVWLTDRTSDDRDVVFRVTRASTEPLAPMLFLTSADQRPAFGGGHVYRGKLVPDLVGKYVYSASGGRLVAVERFGPSGPAQATARVLGASGPTGRDEQNELAIATARGVLRVVDATRRGGPTPAPSSLLATKCFDLAGVPVGAIPYDVTTALWSDGAAKERFVVVPKGAKITARPDGDLVFPVGTVAVKTFAVDGKRIETRLLVQHDVEDWVGYSYAWNAAGTDADLVTGNRIAPLAGGKTWYFPSTGDCAACHTPAAGYTLGLEAKQLAGRGDALARLEDKLRTPIEKASLASLVPVDAPAPATAEARARSYLHANCSMCHREGSATGNAVDLDLRIDTPLAKTGLCREPQAGALGLADARIVAPRDPARSVIVARMRALDERRMPKLATTVVDEAGAGAVEAWIRDLNACP
jgi:uncharacterized repeat protein (TIGR03806 family)